MYSVTRCKTNYIREKNEFEILYENKSIYTATLAFINIIGSLNLENLRKIKVYDKNSNLKYKTEYNYFLIMQKL